MLHVVGNQDKIVRQSARGEDQVKIIQTFGSETFREISRVFSSLLDLVDDLIL
jgi:hypothetical protein